MMRKNISTQLSKQVIKKEEESVRYSEYKINPLILNRWSPRSMPGDEELSNEELMPIFEAARWAPSAFNTQHLLADGNKDWAKNAAVLTVIISKKEFKYNGRVLSLTTRQFDTGAAWENLALEASSRGFVAHAIAGFDYDKARKDLDIPDGYDDDRNRNKAPKRESSSKTSGDGIS